ncbi:MAG TPA: hypothetical protein VF719_11055, partial [Abditibacteriaceae bacterium]
NGDITNGDIDMEWSYDGATFTQFPSYQYFPVDACPTSYHPAPRKQPSKVQPKNVVVTAGFSKQKSTAILLPNGSASPAYTLVRRPDRVPTATPAPTATRAPTATPAPTWTPIPGATPTPTDVAVPTAGPTPVPGDGDAGVVCKNTVPANSIIRVTVAMQHQPLTGFFPFLRRNIAANSLMRRE